MIEYLLNTNLREKKDDGDICFSFLHDLLSRVSIIQRLIKKSMAIGLAIWLFVLCSSHSARADELFYETVGISVAVGTILGASTLPFYAQPTDQIINVAIGAGLGAVVGLGLWLYLDSTAPNPYDGKSVSLRERHPAERPLLARAVPIPSGLPKLESKAWSTPWIAMSFRI